MSLLYKSTALLLIVFFSVTLFVSLISMPRMHEHTMQHGSDCPFILPHNTACLMNFTDHLSAWKTAFVSAIPTSTSYLNNCLLLCIALIPAMVTLHVFRRISLLYLCGLRQRYSLPDRQLQELFSSGILNPKVFQPVFVTML